MPALTEAHLRIPLTAAKWFLRKRPYVCRVLNLDLEELTNIGNLALALSVANWDESRSPGGAVHYGSYLVQQVRWRLRNEVVRLFGKGRNPRRRHASLDAEIGDDFKLADTLSRPDSSLASVEVRETARLLLASLSPEDQEIARLVWMQDMTLKDAARVVGRSQQTLSSRLTKIRYRMQKLPSMEKWRQEVLCG
jgi:RNA polymerase sigma factor (sigma-70 family)